MRGTEALLAAGGLCNAPQTMMTTRERRSMLRLCLASSRFCDTLRAVSVCHEILEVQVPTRKRIPIPGTTAPMLKLMRVNANAYARMFTHSVSLMFIRMLILSGAMLYSLAALKVRIP